MDHQERNHESVGCSTHVVTVRSGQYRGARCADADGYNAQSCFGRLQMLLVSLPRLTLRVQASRFGLVEGPTTIMVLHV